MTRKKPHIPFRLAVAAAVLSTASIASAQLFSENFDDLNAGSRWSVAVQTESTADPSTGPDGSVNFAFDYSTLGIANPAGSGSTIGAFIQVNKTDQVGDEGETYIIFPTGFSVSGNFSLSADMFVWNDGLSGTTELGMAGVFLNNANPVAPYQWGSEGGPLAWIYSGEGGSTADLATFREGTSTTTGYSAISDYNAVPADSIPGFETGVTGSSGPAGTDPSGSWVNVKIVSADSMLSWYLNDALVDTYDNTAGFYNEGNIFLGTTDPFNSANFGGGAIVENVVVVPEPSTYALGLMGAIGAFFAMRRKK